jgi:hypothetical protein
MIGAQVPVGAGNFSLHHHCVQTGSGAQPASYPIGARGSFSGGNVAGGEADHSPPPSARVNMHPWHCAQLKHRNTFNFTFMLYLTTLV